MALPSFTDASFLDSDITFNDGKLTYGSSGNTMRNGLSLGPSMTLVPLSGFYVRDIYFIGFRIPAASRMGGTGTFICLDPDRTHPILLHSLSRCVVQVSRASEIVLQPLQNDAPDGTYTDRHTRRYQGAFNGCSWVLFFQWFYWCLWHYT